KAASRFWRTGNGVTVVPAIPRSCRAGLFTHSRTLGDQPSSMLITATPSGFERFFARCDEESRSRGGAPDMARLVAIAEFISCCRYDLEVQVSCVVMRVRD